MRMPQVVRTGWPPNASASHSESAHSSAFPASGFGLAHCTGGERSKDGKIAGFSHAVQQRLVAESIAGARRA